MRTFCILLLSVFTIFSNFSCHHNRLKTNEKELAKEVFVQEKKNEETERAASEKESETRSRFSGGLRKKELRSVDPQRPPVRIDVPGTTDNTLKLKLSDVASSIRYIKLQTPPDTLLLYDHFFYRPELESIIRSDGEQIIFQGLFGLTRFNMQGEYQETIWKNETGIKFYGKGVFFGGQDFFGVLPHIPVSMLNGNLYYSFLDGPAKNNLVIKYKFENNIDFQNKSHSEIQGQQVIRGDTLLCSNKYANEGFEKLFATGLNSWAGINNIWNAGKTGSLLVTFNDSGDTLCQFTNFDRIENFTSTTWRQTADFTGYFYNGLLTIKQEYNDTLFRLIPPDRLLPVYILDFGKYKLNFKDGLNPDFDLSGKYILNSLFETNEYILIRYTENYDAPNTRKKNAVKLYNALFNKKDGKLYHQPGFSFLPEGLENDLDGGMPFWPDFITPQGEMMKLVSGKVIKDFVNSATFKEAVISEKDRQKQILMASGLRATDMIVIIVK